MAARLLTPKAAAEYLGISPSGLLARARKGEIGCVRFPGRQVVCPRVRDGVPETLTYTREVIRFRIEDLDAAIAKFYRPERGGAALPVPRPRGLKPWEQIPAHQREF